MCDLCIITFHFDCLNGSLKVIWTALRGLKEIFTIKLVSKKGGAKSTHTMFYIYYWPFCRYNFIIDEIKEKTENNGEKGRGNGISKCREPDLNFCRLHEHQSSANSVRTTKLLNICNIVKWVRRKGLDNEYLCRFVCYCSKVFFLYLKNSNAHQGCIYLITNTVKNCNIVKYHYNLKTFYSVVYSYDAKLNFQQSLLNL